MRFLLASESARCIDLLHQAGYDFEAVKSGFAEVVLPDPRETAEANARGKALAVAEERPGELVLAADTVVYIPDERAVLGQARDAAEVRRMLGLLKGRAHEVYSGVAVVRDGIISVESVVTRVRMLRLQGEELEAYAALGEGVGKAGGYAIQGRAALFIEGIEGDYSNVVGLPLALTSRMLSLFGVRWY